MKIDGRCHCGEITFEAEVDPAAAGICRGNKRRHAFCGNCGTTIYACAVENPQSYSPGTALGGQPRRSAFRRQRLTPPADRDLPLVLRCRGV
jgi:hypothetical protein